MEVEEAGMPIAAFLIFYKINGEKRSDWYWNIIQVTVVRTHLASNIDLAFILTFMLDEKKNDEN